MTGGDEAHKSPPCFQPDSLDFKHILLCPDQEKLDFLRALSASCTEALENGRNELGLPHKKVELVKAIMVVMESLPVTPVPSPVISCAMLALYHLSKFEPSLDRDLESYVLRLVLYYVFTMESTSVRSQDFYISSCLTLEVLLKGLLVGDATSAHLLFLIKHINFWLESSGNKEKMRALTCASALIGHAIYVLGPEVRLSQILSQDLWCQDDCGTEMLGYIDTCMAVEAFGEILNQAQKEEMIKTAWLAAYNFWLTTSVPGILILYAVVGKASVFLLDKNPGHVYKKTTDAIYRLQKEKRIPRILEVLLYAQGNGSAKCLNP
ncbi:hypothetical protein JD844_009535 [Phrynosoma platyrhinos]|uniref:Uncharacterized protein n=1 Tax=Phrynosoma platyrhinos TaxID=52577 RepID=A0ABQ7TF91_PHRPL|nr:hypothetical protein JD844_009535 [Phrynosoma platyrhinos]